MALGDISNTSHQETPVRGWKKANIISHLRPDALVLKSERFNYIYSSRGVANCRYIRHYGSPDTNGYCPCGFNAYRSADILLNNHYFGYIKPDMSDNIDEEFYYFARGVPCILEVDLYGTVVEYEDGYRAEKQDIISVYMRGNQDNLATMRKELSNIYDNIEVLCLEELIMRNNCYILDLDYMKPDTYGMFSLSIDSLEEALEGRRVLPYTHWLLLERGVSPVYTSPNVNREDVNRALPSIAGTNWKVDYE